MNNYSVFPGHCMSALFIIKYFGFILKTRLFCYRRWCIRDSEDERIINPKYLIMNRADMQCPGKTL
jgi:hypothetical protein